MTTTTRSGRKLPAGPWADEPDKVQWIDETTDLDCLIVRGPMGALCGYVGVPPTHPLYGRSYDACLNPGCTNEDYISCWNAGHRMLGDAVSVHGGLTFADACQEDDPEGICHIPEPGRSPHMWWFGFDCAHSGDLAPAMRDDLIGLRAMPSFMANDVYRDIDYVRTNCTALATQLAALG